MTMTNAERQKRWRDKRNALVREIGRTRNVRLDALVADRLKRGKVTAQSRRLAVQRLLKDVDPEEDAELLMWLRAWGAPR